MKKYTSNAQGFILITSIVLMFVTSSIIFAYFIGISHEYQRVEINIAQARAKYNALSGFGIEAYENMFFRDFIEDTLANGEPADSVQYYVSGSIEEMGTIPIKEGEDWMGGYNNVSVRIAREDDNVVRHGYALGISNYTNIFGKTITITDSVDIRTKWLPGLNEWMYLTGDEHAGGAPQIHKANQLQVRSEVKFGTADSFEGGEQGKFQTNGVMITNNGPPCPTFENTVTVTENCDGTVNDPILEGNGCGSCCEPYQLVDHPIFQGDPPLDTALAYCLPPPSFDQSKQFADYTFDATELLVSNDSSYPGGNQRDVLIMTELEFLSSGGFRVSRYKYLMPPHLTTDLTLDNIPTFPQNPNPSDLETTEFNGVNNTGCPNIVGQIDNCPQYEILLNRYHARERTALGNEPDIPIDIEVGGSHGVHHFDTHIFEYDPGRDCAFEPNSVPGNSKSTEYTTEYYFPTKPVAIYIKGGPVLVHGIFKGRYTVITDELMTYRRHAFPDNNQSPTDIIYCNIWLVGDLINYDATEGPNGEWGLYEDDALPDDDCKGGSENIMGLVSGANVIIANTRENGARNGIASGGNDHINIHAHIIAFNESFVMHYWQNSSSYWNDWNVTDWQYGDPNTTKADGNGLRYGSQTTTDERGKIYLWGGIVQSFRGYMRRNCTGPYCDTSVNPFNIGMEKAYRWDDNLRCTRPPLYPPALTCEEACIDDDTPPQFDFKIAQFRIY